MKFNDAKLLIKMYNKFEGDLNEVQKHFLECTGIRLNFYVIIKIVNKFTMSLKNVQNTEKVAV